MSERGWVFQGAGWGKEMLPSNYGYRLGNRKPNPASHVKQEKEIRNKAQGKLYRINNDEPGKSAPRPFFPREAGGRPHHGGSLTKLPSDFVVPGGTSCLHGRTRAQMLKAFATGPRVPAIMGKAEDANHQRLWRC